MIKRFFLSLVYILLLLHTKFEALPTCVIPSLLTDLRVAAQSVEPRERPTLDMPLFRFACMPNFSFCSKLYVYLAIVQIPLSTSGLCYFIITPTYIYLYIFKFKNRCPFKGSVLLHGLKAQCVRISSIYSK